MTKDNNNRCLRGVALALPALAGFEAYADEVVSNQATQSVTTQEVAETTEESMHSEGLIADLALILLLGAVVTILFKKLKQPVVLGYILAGFLASPKFEYLPSIAHSANIDFWAELGIVVLMFTLGLEFSFKKLLNSGSSAVTTALIIITGMTFAGFGVGHLLGLDSINSIFLGGMLSMSSTTIILKAFTDLGLKQKKFASLVLAVLIIEDLFAVLMLVLLSSLAMGNVEGSELLFSVAKLAFFLILWFVIGVYVLPTFFDRTRWALNNETLLVVSMGLCFGMAFFSVFCGFSLELGAFVTGSILAGTMIAERIEKVVQPIKDLFGAVFFISVGMMVDPNIIVQYWGEILLLACVVICGMITFGTLGMLATGQTLRVAMESGFSLTQIGEFSFIIASLGMSLGVLDPTLYPIIVAVSVITIFTTPYFIKLADPAYRFVEKHLPKGLNFLIERYSTQTVDTNERRQLWKAILGRYLWRIVLYSVLLIGVILVSRLWLYPLLEGIFVEWGHFIATVVTLLLMSPFIGALSFSSVKPDERMKLHSTAGMAEVPLVVLKIVRYLLALCFVVYFVSLAYTMTIGWLVGVGCFVLIIVVVSKSITQRYKSIEKKFIDNLNVRENTRSGKNNNLVDDLHLAYIEVSLNCPFAGDKIVDTGLRRDYGVSISSIYRGFTLIALPGKDVRIFPGDLLGVIGTDEQIQRLNADIESYEDASEHLPVYNEQIELVNVLLTKDSAIVGKTLVDARIRQDYYSMVVKIQRGDEMLVPTPDVVFEEGDVLWIVGNPKNIEKLR